MDKETFIQILMENGDGSTLLHILKRGKHSDKELNYLWITYNNHRIKIIIDLNETAIKQLELFRKDLKYGD